MRYLIRRTNVLCSVTALSVGAVVLFGLLFPLLLGIRWKLAHFVDRIHDGPYSVDLVWPVVLIAFLPFVVTVYVWRRSGDFSWRLIVGLFASALIVRTVFVLHIQEPMNGDYRAMWEYAVRLSQGAEAGRAREFTEVRALFYFLPIAYLGNGARLWVELTNVVTTLMTSLIAFLYVRWVAGSRAGAAILVLILFAPEPIFSAEASTHDIPGVFFFLAGLLAFGFGLRIYSVVGHTTRRIWLLWGVGCVAIAFAELQRSIGIFSVVALWLILGMVLCKDGVRDKRRIVESLILGLLPVLSIAMVTNAFALCCIDKEALEERRMLGHWGWVAAYAVPSSTGEYTEYASVKSRMEHMEKDKWASSAIRHVISEHAKSPMGILRQYYEKSSRLFNLGRQGREYYSTSPYRQMLDAYMGAYAFALMGASVLGLVALFGLRVINILAVFPLLALSILSFALILLGEIQSRYVTAAWYVLPLAIGCAVERARWRDFDSKLLLIRFLCLVVLGGVALVVFRGVVMLAAQTY